MNEVRLPQGTRGLQSLSHSHLAAQFLQNPVLQLGTQHPWEPQEAREGMGSSRVAAGVAPSRPGGEGRLVQTSRWEMMPQGTGARSAPGFFQMPAGPQHPGRAEERLGPRRWEACDG